MSFFKRLGALLSPPQPSCVMHYYVRCRRCGEVIKARADLRNELSIEYGEDERPSGYSYRKVLIGSGRCFQAIEVTMTFDPQRRVVSREVTGGEFVAPDE
ncbi:MAG TPA: hypothetical protein PLJ35_19585 [Anaerolineae bacterium]|nr:hypothetical protein [Anaerolineae bacterium]HOR01024.1 hypothetical protein [Anaerolineae bacterium]HPL29170.1 hypothetical protein [Anaerolineae bacterium]